MLFSIKYFIFGDIEIYFGLNFDNADLCAVSFCFRYYLGKRRPPQVYVEISNCIFRLNRCNNKPKAKFQKIFFLGKDLTTYKDFLQRVELSFKEQNFKQKIESLHYVGKCVMCLSFQAEYFPSHEYAFKLVVLTEEQFDREKILRELGWCANYLMDKRENNDFIIDFVFIIILVIVG